MRTEQEMMDVILGAARENGNVRAAYLNGSRANPNVAKDPFRDYDVVYVVTKTEPFLADRSWLSVFGETAIVQEPDSNDLGWGIGHDFSRSYAWLMLFEDGNRIDLTIQTVEVARENYTKDTLTIPLLDKDGILPELPPASDSGYWVKKPERPQFDGCCNEFWWCLNNIAKGIRRDQLSYVMRMYFETVHKELERMLSWYIAGREGYAVSVGMWGKYFKKYLPPELYGQFVRTYPDGDYEHIWDAVFTACELFRTVGKAVALACGYVYPRREDERTTRYLTAMKNNL